MAEVSVQEFAQMARTFLEANAKRREADTVFTWGSGDDRIGLFDVRKREAELDDLQSSRAWRSKKFDAGFGWITGPTGFGGAGLSDEYERTYREIESEFDVPPDAFGMGLRMVAPTIVAHGTDEVQQRFLRGIYRGDLVACQLFSEPEAGSDLASLRTTARRDGDGWVLNGQKVWTSGAHHADIGEVLARTDSTLPKHKGITAFIVDMHSPGIDVRPLRQMNGNENFNEVFLNDVYVPDSFRLGPVNDGWRVAVTTLNNERASMGADRDMELLATRLIEMARHHGVSDDPVIRDELAKAVTSFRVAYYTSQRALARVNAGQAPGPELAMSKQAGILNLRLAASLAARILGPRIIADVGEWGTWPWAQFLLTVPGQRIGGGTDEVMRNVVAERVLGLPKEPSIQPQTTSEQSTDTPPRGGKARLGGAPVTPW